MKEPGVFCGGGKLYAFLVLVVVFLADLFDEVKLTLAVVSFNSMVGKEMPRVEKECFFVGSELILLL